MLVQSTVHESKPETKSLLDICREHRLLSRDERGIARIPFLVRGRLSLIPNSVRMPIHARTRMARWFVSG